MYLGMLSNLPNRSVLGRLLPLKESRDAHNKCNSRIQKLNNSNGRDEKGLVREQAVWRRKKGFEKML